MSEMGPNLSLALSASEVWVVATAVCCAVACALPGCFLVLRRLSMLGDAIAHAILPGLALAFLITQSRAPAPMLVGAMAAGLIAAAGSAGVRRLARLPEDTSLGLVFSAMFALGVILISFAARSVDLDPGCVLYGMLELVNFDRVVIMGVEMPRSFAWLAAVLGVNAIVIALLFKELRLTSFDPELARSMGLSPWLVGSVLLVLTTATCVASFEAVGSILVVAMLVAPGASASLLTARLGRMLLLAAVIAGSTAVGGYLLAARLNVTAAGMMSALSGGVFVACVLLSPRRGVLPSALRRLGLTVRIAREDLLADAYRAEERPSPVVIGVPSTIEGRPRQHGRYVLSAVARWSARWRGELLSGDALTERGRATARDLIRSHRLWESYLASHLPLAADHLHEPSHRAEHFIDPQTQRDIARQVPDSESDPHGKPIPAGDHGVT